MLYSHLDYIESKLEKPISKKGIIEVGINFNDYFSFEEANKYAALYSENFIRKATTDKSRQEKSSKDSILGKLVEEVIIYLLDEFFQANKRDFTITNDKNENKIVRNIIDSLCIERIRSRHIKTFDTDIIVYNNQNVHKTRRVFILSAKGTTRERIGQFLSHLFLMDQDVLNAKYGKNKYEVIFDKENILLKYAFVTLDWAADKDFVKYTKTRKERESVKETEVQLILDDKKLGGGIYVLNNNENFDGIGNFTTLVGTICDFLK
jgi:hypothetical protein